MESEDTKLGSRVLWQASSEKSLSVIYIKLLTSLMETSKYDVNFPCPASAKEAIGFEADAQLTSGNQDRLGLVPARIRHVTSPSTI